MGSPSGSGQLSPDRGGPRKASRAVSPVSGTCPAGVRGPAAEIYTARTETVGSTSGGSVADGLSARLVTRGNSARRVARAANATRADAHRGHSAGTDAAAGMFRVWRAASGNWPLLRLPERAAVAGSLPAWRGPSPPWCGKKLFLSAARLLRVVCGFAAFSDAEVLQPVMPSSFT